jgi:hypothetical protein
MYFNVIFMFYKLLHFCLILSTTILLNGCFATIFSGSIQEIKIKVLDGKGGLVEGVQCSIHNPSGASIFLPSNPGKVIVQRGSGLLSIDCKKAGYRKSDVMVGESFNKVALFNILWLPGFAVDAVTGAYKKYPSHYLVIMEKSD